MGPAFHHGPFGGACPGAQLHGVPFTQGVPSAHQRAHRPCRPSFTQFITPAHTMPVVGVNRDKLFEALGQTYSEFVLCTAPRCPAMRHSCCFAAATALGCR
jgi:hypothetical protein